MVPLLWVLVSPNIQSTKENGPALARLAIGEDVEGVSVVYSEGRRQIKSSVDSYDEKKQEALWEWTVKTVAVNSELWYHWRGAGFVIWLGTSVW